MSQCSHLSQLRSSAEPERRFLAELTPLLISCFLAVVATGSVSAAEVSLTLAGSNPVAGAPRLDLVLGAPSRGVIPISVPMDALDFPMLRTSDVPPWIPRGWTRARLAAPATGVLVLRGPEPFLQIDGKIAVERGSLGTITYDVTLFSEIPIGHRASDQLDVLVYAAPTDTEGPGRPVRGQIKGLLEGLQ